MGFTSFTSPNMAIIGSKFSRVFASLCAMTAALAVIGCGVGPVESGLPPSGESTTQALVGKLYGGPTPLVNATVKLYATGSSSGGTSSTNTGYGVGTELAEATQQGASAHQDTSATGTFTIPDGYDCPAGQFAYLVSTGGSTGGSSANSNSVLVAALGRCEDLYNYNSTTGAYTGYKRSNIYINELTTIAAAYALGHFSSEVSPGSGASTQVLIGADAGNNAAQVTGVSTGCVSGVGACTTTAAAGLAHAFINASLLVNIFTNTGTANATVPGNSSAIVPRQLINTLGNVLISCVNSTGGTAGSSTVCGKLFTDTTIGTNVPSDTWGAMVNLAANPTLGASSTNVVNLFNLISPTLAIYTPSYSSATSINDYSIAINYPAASFSMTYPYTGATDINDVFYAGNTAGSGSAPAGIVAFNYTQATSPTITVNAGATNSSFTYTYGLSVDGLGRGYFGNGSASSSNAVGYFSTNSGSPGAITTAAINTSTKTAQLSVYATAIDLKNHLWAFGISGSASGLYECPASFTSSSTCTAEYATTGAITSAGALLAVDPNQNIWDGAGQLISVFENTGTAATPAYANNYASESYTDPDPLLGIAFTGAATAPSVYVSGSNSYYQPGLETITTTYTGASVTSFTAGTNQFGVPYEGTPTSTTMSTPYGSSADGLSTVWIADYVDHAIFQTTPGATSPAAYKLAPCLGGSTTCSSIFTSPSGATDPTSVAVDASGSIWITAVYPSASYSGQVVQIIGSAAPTWPLLSLGKTGEP